MTKISAAAFSKLRKGRGSGQAPASGISASTSKGAEKSASIDERVDALISSGRAPSHIAMAVARAALVEGEEGEITNDPVSSVGASVETQPGREAAGEEECRPLIRLKRGLAPRQQGISPSLPPKESRKRSAPPTAEPVRDPKKGKAVAEPSRFGVSIFGNWNEGDLAPYFEEHDPQFLKNLNPESKYKADFDIKNKESVSSEVSAGYKVLMNSLLPADDKIYSDLSREPFTLCFAQIAALHSAVSASMIRRIQEDGKFRENMEREKEEWKKKESFLLADQKKFSSMEAEFSKMKRSFDDLSLEVTRLQKVEAEAEEAKAKSSMLQKEVTRLLFEDTVRQNEMTRLKMASSSMEMALRDAESQRQAEIKSAEEKHQAELKSAEERGKALGRASAVEEYKASEAFQLTLAESAMESHEGGFNLCLAEIARIFPDFEFSTLDFDRALENSAAEEEAEKLRTSKEGSAEQKAVGEESAKETAAPEIEEKAADIVADAIEAPTNE